jgi:serine/threonine protein phosphatase PrpC
MIRTEVRLGWKSIPGHRHRVEGRENQDLVLTSREHPYFDALMIVADGMGGHAEPRLAAQTAANAARDFLFHPDRLGELLDRRTEPLDLLRRAVEHANAHVRRLADASPGVKAPGSTLTVAVVANGRFAAAHVGDGSVFLFREGRLRPLVGGETRRIGSRPVDFLGRDDRLAAEAAAERVRPGDRFLLCTDGLTRYFGSGNSSLDRLQQVMARPTADPQALASQLTADGRGEQYDDDTSVVIMEIGASREVPDPPGRGSDPTSETARSPARPLSRSSEALPPPLARSPPRPFSVWPLASAALVALIAIAGLAWWRPWRILAARPTPFRAYTTPSVDLSGLPRGGILLVHPESGRFYVLRTRPLPAPETRGPLVLRELRLRPGGGLTDSGNSYRLDLSRGRLTDPKGRSYPVLVDGSGIVEVQQAGKLRVELRPPGLAVWIDGQPAGFTPLEVRVRSGRHQVRVGGQTGIILDTPVEVPAAGVITLSKDAPPSSAQRAVPNGSAGSR